MAASEKLPLSEFWIKPWKHPEVTRDIPSSQSSQTMSMKSLENGTQCKHHLLWLLNSSTSEETPEQDKCELSNLPPFVTPIHQSLASLSPPTPISSLMSSCSPHSSPNLSFPCVSHPPLGTSARTGCNDNYRLYCRALLARGQSSHSTLIYSLPGPRLPPPPGSCVVTISSWNDGPI